MFFILELGEAKMAEPQTNRRNNDELYGKLERLIGTNEELVDAIKTTNEQNATLWRLVVTGDPENNKPSMLETVRSHGNFIGGFKRAGWILIGVVITLVPAFIWYTSYHVAAAK